METVSGQQLCQEAGLTYRQLDNWVRRDVLAPIDSPLPGSGHPRPFELTEIRVARLVLTLRQFGANLDVLGEVAAQAREWEDEEWAGVVYVDGVGLVRREVCATCWAVDLAAVAAPR